MLEILIVEDEILIAEEIRDCLSQQGFGISSLVESGESAIEAIKLKKPAAVVMDIKLQGEIDGISTAEEIYNKWNIPCVFLTSYSDREFLDRAKKVGAYGYIVKPFSDFELTAAVEMALYKSKMEAEKQRLEAQLQHAMKMEAIGTLAGGIAHDFNNILGVILGYSELIEEDLTNAGLKTDHIKEVLNASEKAKNLIKQILTFSRKDILSKEPVDLKLFTDSAFTFLRASIPTTINIDINVEKQLGPVLVDPTQLLQVLMNLCTNSAQAMEKTGGTISIDVKRNQPHSLDLPDLLNHTNAPFICLSVSDTGPGIAQDIKEKIFDPYFTTKDAGKGSGLGLSIVHSIIKKSNGIIKLDSDPGQGCTFHIYLPETEIKPARKIKTTPDKPFKGPKHILLVDDDETILNIQEKLLLRSGFGVTKASSSEVALALFKEMPDSFDAVITDQTMPKITGTQLSKKILTIRPNLPVILCTGYSATVDEASAKKMGIRGFIMKPYERSKLTDTLNQIFSG